MDERNSDRRTVRGTAVIVRRPEEIGRAREFAVAVSTDAGLDAERADFLAFAVSEATANALLHGLSAAVVRVTAAPAEVIAEVRDTGPGFRPAPPGRPLPGPHAEAGRGLWLVERLVDAVDIRTGPGGTTVRMMMRR